MTTTRTTCPYCGVGCGVLVEQQAGGEVIVKGDPLHPANQGRLCSKGSALAETLEHPERLLYPEVNGQRVDWETASSAVADKFSQIIAEHGPEAVAFYVSGQLLTEDYYVANKLMKGYIGAANIDTNSRLCMASAVAAHKRAFGEDLVPCSYEDLDAAELIVLIGSNTAWCHPVLYQRMVAAKAANPALRVVLVDPRRTQTADIADLHLPVKPGSDAFLFNGLLAWLADQGKSDQQFIRQHTNGVENVVQTARQQCGSIASVAEQCGLEAASVEQFFAWFGSTKKVVSVFSQGINQSSSGVDKGNAIINCHLLTGRIGYVGAGPFSFTGQPNAMGGREVGGLANQLAVHRDIENPQHRAAVKAFWQSPRIAQKQGLKAVDLFTAIRAGQVKAVWIMATNPAVSLPDSANVLKALQQCECVVVSDCVANSDTLRYADIRLPALTWGERDGTVTNSDRTISRQRPFLPTPGEARADWYIICDVAAKMGWRKAFAYQNSWQIFREYAALSGDQNNGERCFDISALADISHEAFDALQPLQWPVRKDPVQPGKFISQQCLFADGHFYTADRRACFIPVEARLPLAVTNAELPLLLNTGRVRDQWHTMTRTGITGRLAAHCSEPYLEIHPQDAVLYGVMDGALTQVMNPGGMAIVRAQYSAEQQRGSVFMPMHWNSDFSAAATVNALTNAIVDPISGQPESKQAAVQIKPYLARWHGFLLSRRKLNLTVLLAEQGIGLYWSMRRAGDAWQYTLAHDSTLKSHETLAHILLQQEQAINRVEYLDSANQTYRFAGFTGAQLDSCLFISKQDRTLPPTEWLLSLFTKAALSDAERQSLLSGKAAGAMPDNGKVVCSCFNVGEKTIQRALVEQGCKTVEELGDCLKAGTNCGSCLPELRTLLAG